MGNSTSTTNGICVDKMDPQTILTVMENFAELSPEERNKVMTMKHSSRTRSRRNRQRKCGLKEAEEASHNFSSSNSSTISNSFSVASSRKRAEDLLADPQMILKMLEQYGTNGDSQGYFSALEALEKLTIEAEDLDEDDSLYDDVMVATHGAS